MKLLQIDWLDSYCDLESEELKDYVMHTIGWYVKENKHYIQLAQNIMGGEPHAPYMNINKKWIKSKKQL